MTRAESVLSRVLPAAGALLMLGGLGHSVGVGHFYWESGVPASNRVLLDLWIAQAHLLGGGLYLCAWRSLRQGAAWRVPAIFGALTVIGYAGCYLPVLFARSSVSSQAMVIFYLAVSLLILIFAARSAPPNSARSV